MHSPLRRVILTLGCLYKAASLYTWRQPCPPDPGGHVLGWPRGTLSDTKSTKHLFFVPPAPLPF